MFFGKKKFDIKQLKLNKFIFDVKQFKINEFIFDVKQFKMNRFIKSISDLIIITSNAALEAPSLRPCPGPLSISRSSQNSQNCLGPQEYPLRDAWKEFIGSNNKFFIFKKLQFFSYKSFSILNRLLLGNNLLEIFNSMFKSINHDRPNTQLIDTLK